MEVSFIFSNQNNRPVYLSLQTSNAFDFASLEGRECYFRNGLCYNPEPHHKELSFEFYELEEP